MTEVAEKAVGVGISTVQFGVIGYGSRLKFVSGLLKKAAGEAVRLAYVTDLSGRCRAHASELSDKPMVSTDYREMLADPAVSWVLIGSHNSAHREHAVAALEAGKNVFCEKPLATTIEDCVAIHEAHRRSGRQFMVGFVLRYAPLYRHIIKLVRSGVLGSLISLEFNETLDFNHGGFIMSNWRRLTSLSGGHLLEKCCHDVDIVNWIIDSRPIKAASFGGLSFFTPGNEKHIDRLGKDAKGRDAYRTWGGPVNVNPFTGDKDIIDHQVAIFEYANGVKVSFHTNCNSGLPERRMYLNGTEGALRADLLTGQIEYRRIGFDEQIQKVDLNEVAGGHGGGDEVMAEQLKTCMLEGAEPATPLATGLVAAVTCLRAEEARHLGKVVDFNAIWARV